MMLPHPLKQPGETLPNQAALIKLQLRHRALADFSRRLMMRLTCVALLALALTPARAQVEVIIPQVGSVKTSTVVQNGILGVTTSLARSRGTARECVGSCFYANVTKTKTWTCRTSDCEVDCSGREPVGGC
jgi:hypothetical protein